nr:choice-of-anchor J domain-containing protein [candidate division Zixibacteria bacterium]
MQDSSRVFSKRNVFVNLPVAVITLLAILATASFGGEIRLDYSFDYPQIEQVMIANDLYDRIIMPGAPNGGQPGEPALPARGASILIAYGEEITGISLIPGERIKVTDGLLVEPVGRPYPLSIDPSLVSPPTPDKTIYALNQPIPQDRFRKITTQTFRGYDYVTLRLNPVEYIPASGELYYYPRMQVVVSTAATGKAAPMYRGYAEDERLIEARVDNPEASISYRAASMRADRSYDLLIITTSAMSVFFQTLKEYHDTTGIPTEIHTLESIGGNDPETIRNYIRERYLNDGIQHVLIGGDDDIIPAIDLYIESWPGPDNYVDYNMPGDHYFGCLDGTYNYDGDGYNGEPTDGEGGGEVDLVAEVYVGRASISSAPEAYAFVSKTIAYLSSEDDYLDDVLMVGEQLTFGGWGEYGGYSCDEIIDHSEAHGYATQGIPSKIYNVEKLYDLTYPGNDWPQSAFTSRVNGGVHLVNHYGHCNTSYALKMTSSDCLSQFTNNDFCFIYSQGCYAGNFDDAECWAEYATIKGDHGAFAAIMNARYGWGDYNTDGPSQRFNREYWDAIYNPSEAKPEIGYANQDSKEDNIYRIDESCMRWCFYQLTLFGDPTISFKKRNGITFNYPDGLPEYALTGQATGIEVDLIPVGDATAGVDSGVLKYRIDGGDWLETSLISQGGTLYQAEIPALECGQAAEYYLVATETSGEESFVDPDPLAPYTLYVIESEIALFEDNFETDKGWTVSGGLWARGIPTGQGGSDQQYPQPDPTWGSNGDNVYGYNLNGDYENSMVERHLTSPVINCQGHENIRLTFDRWLGVEGGGYDHAYVRVSNNGSDWTTVWENSATLTDLEWVPCRVDISDVADGETTVYIRFTMGTSDSWSRYCGWNIDNLAIMAYDCQSYVCGDANGNGAVNILDATYLISYLYKSGPPPVPMGAGDASGNGAVNILDVTYLISYLYKSGPAPICP